MRCLVFVQKSAKLARLYRLEHSLCFVPWRYLLGLDIPKLSVKMALFPLFLLSQPLGLRLGLQCLSRFCRS